jgi:PhnB protein
LAGILPAPLPLQGPTLANCSHDYPAEVTVEMSPYLSFCGNCEAAFSFYQRCLGGKLGAVFRYRGTSLADQVPADWQDKVMHATLSVGGQVVAGADIAPDHYEQPKGISLSLQVRCIADAERIFRELATDGIVVTELEPTFWAARFGVVRDRFGIPWLINCDGSAETPEAASR